MDSPESTATREREQWRARILRALAELETAPPGTQGTSPDGAGSADAAGSAEE